MKALFLDRDGIINVDHGYVSTIDEFEFMDAIIALLKLFSEAGFISIIVTNQSGIGRGYYSKEDFDTLSSWLIAELKKKEIDIRAIYHCPHSPDQNCNCRKPSIGMIEEALTEYPITLEKSWMIGDKESDIQLAHNAKIGNSIFIGEKALTTATLSFQNVAQCYQYFQENKDKIYH